MVPWSITNASECKHEENAIKYGWIGAQHINSNCDLENTGRILGIPKVNTPYPTDGTNGHGVREMGHEKWKMGTMFEGLNLSDHRISCTT